MKAAEGGKDGNPNEYRNFVVQPYVYQPRVTVAEWPDPVEAKAVSLH
jgi:hypothetical protein